MYDVTMPKLSDSMEVGKIIEWKVAEGDEVSEGDSLAEVESDKAVMELECFHDGTVSEIVHGDGEEVPVGEVIAYIAAPGEEGETHEKEEKTEEKPEEKEEAPEAEKEEEEAGLAAADTAAEEEAEAEEKAPEAEKEAAEAEKEEAEAEEGPAETPKAEAAKEAERVRISPYAKKLASKLDVDYTQIEGTGVGGRIMARDVEEAAGGHATLEEARPSADEELPAVEVSDEEAEVEDAPFRLRTQARRVVASKHVIPHFYVTARADVTRLLERKDTLKEEHGASVTHLVMLACLKAISEVPEVNRSYDRGRIIKWKHVNLGLAIQTDEGLTVAVLPRAGELSLEDLVEKTGPLVERAREGKLKGEDRKHPTFTISNLGMYDVEQFQPIINPPSSVTLAVASALEEPVVRGDGIHIARVMRLTASCDHRMIDGVTAARLLQGITSLLADPDRLLDAS